MQHDKPDDFIISTGQQHSVRDFINQASEFIGLKIEWTREGLNEVAINSENGDEIVCVHENIGLQKLIVYLGTPPKQKLSHGNPKLF